MSFLEDYSEGAHPRLLEALARTNTTQQTGYGTDEYTQDGRRLLLAQLNATEEEVSIHFVPTGTAANLTSIASCLRPYEAILAAQTGHIIDKEAGAIEATGHKILAVPATVLDQNTFFPHMAKPRLVYISNATEMGTVYSRQELRRLSETCHQRGLLLLVDGARMGVALAAVVNDVTLRDLVDYTDIFWLGGTKMGALFGEAIVVRKTLSDGFEFHMKQRGALIGKSRALGIQFSGLFRDGLFFELARHANGMARRIAGQFGRMGWQLAAEPETNQVFIVVPDWMLPQLEERIRFYAWEKRKIHLSSPHAPADSLTELCPAALTVPPAVANDDRRRSKVTRATNSPSRASSPHASSPLAALSSSILIAACDLYHRKFPAVNFLHYPSLITELSCDVCSVDPVFLAALLSLCARFMNDPDLVSSETYAQYARAQLSNRAFESPSLHLAQSLVMISLYEWGMATYMIQSLLKSADDHMEHAPEDFLTHAQIPYEQLVRTYWCCFAQDCELSSGARQHFALSFRQISVPLPTSDSDFNFGKATHRLRPAHMSQSSLCGTRLRIERGLAIVTRGFHIFIRILRGKEELDEWRDLQDTTVHYPETTAPAHVALGYGELFAYINLVYFTSVLFLYRDRFLVGPRAYESPEQAGADADETIDRLFVTAQHIGSILSSLDSCGAPVITPYAGFSVFVATHINMYGTVCPARYPGGLERADREKKWIWGSSWWRTLQEENRLYETARSTPQGVGITLAGRFDEYGDIRISRPDPSATRQTTPVRENEVVRTRTPNLAAPDQGILYDFEVEMAQWPFVDEAWSVGFDTGYETTWPALA
ncbi:pyridoxal phosphate-dependent transferase [Aspergillus lucknowensis]|uniref:Pyridoxal phosphate-dependent transferase n=1 Tax=Aspergillus lucknowensis TaxID=176173 RepID=A0ABR4LD72_9EURO